MVSCTEFIPLYSELFRYIEDKAGHAAVERYWKHISDEYVRPRLGALAAAQGIAACWEYWSKTLNEEAADFLMTYDEEKGVYELEMRHCPSKGLLLSLPHMEPYYDYCGHCAALYTPVLAEYGILAEEDYSETDQARCRIKYYLPRE